MNGLLIQWGYVADGRCDTKVDILAYTSSTSYAITLAGSSSGTAYFHNVSQTSFYVNIQSYTNQIRWITIGY